MMAFLSISKSCTKPSNYLPPSHLSNHCIRDPVAGTTLWEIYSSHIREFPFWWITGIDLINLLQANGQESSKATATLKSQTGVRIRFHLEFQIRTRRLGSRGESTQGKADPSRRPEQVGRAEAIWFSLTELALAGEQRLWDSTYSGLWSLWIMSTTLFALATFISSKGCTL